MRFAKMLLPVFLSACVETAVTPVSRNQILISTSAAPACGVTGAQKVAAQMAAIETLRKGYDAFIVGGASSQNNVGVFNSGPTGAVTTTNYNTYGQTTYGNSTTTFTGGAPIFYGTNDASLLVTMFRKGERGYSNAVDARSTLGPDWEKLVEDGLQTCF